MKQDNCYRRSLSPAQSVAPSSHPSQRIHPKTNSKLLASPWHQARQSASERFPACSIAIFTPSEISVPPKKHPARNVASLLRSRADRGPKTTSVTRPVQKVHDQREKYASRRCIQNKLTYSSELHNSTQEQKYVHHLKSIIESGVTF